MLARDHPVRGSRGRHQWNTQLGLGGRPLELGPRPLRRPGATSEQRLCAMHGIADNLRTDTNGQLLPELLPARPAVEVRAAWRRADRLRTLGIRIQGRLGPLRGDSGAGRRRLPQTRTEPGCWLPTTTPPAGSGSPPIGMAARSPTRSRQAPPSRSPGSSQPRSGGSMRSGSGASSSSPSGRQRARSPVQYALPARNGSATNAPATRSARFR